VPVVTVVVVMAMVAMVVVMVAVGTVMAVAVVVTVGTVMAVMTAAVHVPAAAVAAPVAAGFSIGSERRQADNYRCGKGEDCSALEHFRGSF
jgi:hypothetical protein